MGEAKAVSFEDCAGLIHWTPLCDHRPCRFYQLLEALRTQRGQKSRGNIGAKTECRFDRVRVLVCSGMQLARLGIDVGRDTLYR